jgi:hypothetical protein
LDLVNSVPFMLAFAMAYVTAHRQVKFTQLNRGLNYDVELEHL